ncbi:MAG: 50S ribosomal protein L23 [Candidatus Sungbacteria bacterium]|nr:50S ribosomal protein L23 [Candidatus Sungbacteria bacterium]
MGIFSRIFNKDKTKKAAGEQRSAEALPKTEAAAPALKDAMSGLLILRGPHITEKTAAAQKTLSAYTLRIPKNTNKIQVRETVEKRYRVKVESVRITKTHSKIRRVGRREGAKAGVMKAVVTLEKGQSIELGK